MKTKERVVIRIVDDDNDLLEAIGFLLEAEGWDVKKFHSAKDFLVNEASSIPGCILLDVKMPSMNGLELQEEMKKRKINIPIVFLSAHGDIGMAVHTLQNGAVDFLEKPVKEEQLIKAIARAVRIDSLRRGNIKDPDQVKQRMDLLTERENQITLLLSQGLLNREIAERLSISVRTVETHRLRIFKKLGISEISELVQILELYK